jgi:6-phosphofructokinase 1
MTDVIVRNYHDNGLDALVCLGGGGTQKNALRLKAKGLNILTLPKTIDNDVAMTDITFGFDTALGIATDAIDRLHSTAHSHHRIIVVEIMGHRAGWLALGAGIAGGADVILIPEIPVTFEAVCRKIQQRIARGSKFSIVSVAEGAVPKGGQKVYKRAEDELYVARLGGIGQVVGKFVETRCGAETRVTVLGHIQRGGTPTAFDRWLATCYGSEAVRLIARGRFGRMVALQGRKFTSIKIEDALAAPKRVDVNGDTVQTARALGIGFGDET